MFYLGTIRSLDFDLTDEVILTMQCGNFFEIVFWNYGIVKFFINHRFTMELIKNLQQELNIFHEIFETLDIEQYVPD